MEEKAKDITIAKYEDDWRPAPLKNMVSMNSLKSNAACYAVNLYVKNNQKIGIGSGSTVVYAIQRLAYLVKKNNWNVTCVPTSYQSRQLLIENNLPVSDLEMTPELDLVIDGADEMTDKLELIKGGGGCLAQEKIVASMAKTFIVIADYSKLSACLGKTYVKGVPVEVLPMAYAPVKSKIEKLFSGKAVLRQAKCKAGPVITDNGNFILDWHLPKFNDHLRFDRTMNLTPGVVDTGVFIDMADIGIIGLENGSIQTIRKTRDGFASKISDYGSDCASNLD